MTGCKIDTLNEVRNVSREVFTEAFLDAREAREQVVESCSSVTDLPYDDEAEFYLATDDRAGFVVKDNGELCYLFSQDRGRGSDLVRQAVILGADRLDCFDGYLVTFYAWHGFYEVRREENWTPGEPDVVYMRNDAGRNFYGLRWDSVQT